MQIQLLVFLLFPIHNPSNILIAFKLQSPVRQQESTDGIELSILIDLPTFKGIFPCGVKNDDFITYFKLGAIRRGRCAKSVIQCVAVFPFGTDTIRAMTCLVCKGIMQRFALREYCLCIKLVGQLKIA